MNLVNLPSEMSSQIFEEREDDVKVLISNLRGRINNQLRQAAGEQRKQIAREVDRGIEEGTILIQEMEDELKRAPPSYRTQMITRTRAYKKELSEFTSEVKRRISDTNNGRFGDGFGPADPLEAAAASQRARLLVGTESMSRASQSVFRSQQVAAETDEIGQGTIDELGVQRESLIRTRDRLVETQSNLSKSRKILNSMARKVMTNKLILIVIILLELVILAAVIYWRFFRSHK